MKICSIVVVNIALVATPISGHVTLQLQLDVA